jgi:cell division protein FtsB
MLAEANVWDQLTRVVKLLLFIAYLLVVAVWYLPLIHTNERLRKEMLRNEGRIAKQAQTFKQLRAATETLQHNPKAMERLGRERLGYGKPGETIIRFEAPVTTNSVVRP